MFLPIRKSHKTDENGHGTLGHSENPASKTENSNTIHTTEALKRI